MLAGSSIRYEGLYAIVVPDYTCAPRPFRVLDFGESDNIFGRATAMHEGHTAWTIRGGMTLYRALLPWPGSSKTQRQQAESFLIAKYAPPSN